MTKNIEGLPNRFFDILEVAKCHRRLELRQLVALDFPNAPQRSNDVRNRIFPVNFCENFRDRRVRRRFDQSRVVLDRPGYDTKEEREFVQLTRDVNGWQNQAFLHQKVDGRMTSYIRSLFKDAPSIHLLKTCPGQCVVQCCVGQVLDFVWPRKPSQPHHTLSRAISSGGCAQLP